MKDIFNEIKKNYLGNGYETEFKKEFNRAGVRKDIKKGAKELVRELSKIKKIKVEINK